ncbi:MAG: winged helix-turn-helix domain-containing protein [candidate division NC10 bacterium]|nr:winged helix-turn-helix domain-containing protein [candidate division NC10 bacterium]MDE2322506.1 winged helix-turn-helix domain-containing protein [candidate division NC10 bacterium]
MELPKFNETFMPILRTLSNGEVVHHRELIKRVQEQYYSDLSEELLQQKTKSGEVLIENRIAWGKSYLKKGGLVHYPKRGMVQVTEAGKKACAQGVPLRDMESNLMDFYAEEKRKQTGTPVAAEQSPQDMIDAGFSEIEAQTKSELLVSNCANNRYMIWSWVKGGSFAQDSSHTGLFRRRQKDS